ncbi:hypothetical protein LINPERHAP1_LOCUS32886 [Linum perenne]
MNFSLK